MPADYTLRSNWYAFYLAIKHKMSADKALTTMGLMRYRPLKTERLKIAPEVTAQAIQLASEGVSYNRIGFELNLHYDTVRYILGKEAKKVSKPVLKKFSISGIIVHQNDTYEAIGPIEVEALSLNAAVWHIEKDKNGMLRDIKYQEIKQEPA